ncbi:MAG: alpha/beta hydrolase, partial [Polyangiales bacterium]
MLHETSTVFVSQGAALIGRIVRNTSDPSARQPAVVVAGSWLTVKEQMAVHYARKLAARGYTALAFDFAGWGESGGPLREAEIPE